MSSAVKYVLPRFLKLKKVAVNVDRINLIKYSPRYYTVICASEKGSESYNNTILIDKEDDPESYEKINKFLINSQVKD
jgi:hypothetical protein